MKTKRNTDVIFRKIRGRIVPININRFLAQKAAFSKKERKSKLLAGSALVVGGTSLSVGGGAIAKGIMGWSGRARAAATAGAKKWKNLSSTFSKLGRKKVPISPQQLNLGFKFTREAGAKALFSQNAVRNIKFAAVIGGASLTSVGLTRLIEGTTGKPANPWVKEVADVGSFLAVSGFGYGYFGKKYVTTKISRATKAINIAIKTKGPAVLKRAASIGFQLLKRKIT